MQGLTLREKRLLREQEEKKEAENLQKKEILVDPNTVHETEWVGMPEFHQEDTSPFQSIKIHFRNEDDRKNFEKLIGQEFTNKTKSAWFPAYDREKPSNFLYINETEK